MLSYGTIGVNCDPETGTPYGVVQMNRLADWVYDEFFANGENLTARYAHTDFIDEYMADHPEADEAEVEDASQEFWDNYYGEEEEYRLSLPGEGLELGMSYLGGAPLVWVFKSPHKATVRPCSPCVPGAGDLDSKCDDGMECYDLPPDWYYDEED